MAARCRSRARRGAAGANARSRAVARGCPRSRSTASHPRPRTSRSTPTRSASSIARAAEGPRTPCARRPIASACSRRGSGLLLLPTADRLGQRLPRRGSALAASRSRSLALRRAIALPPRGTSAGRSRALRALESAPGRVRRWSRSCCCSGSATGDGADGGARSGSTAASATRSYGAVRGPARRRCATIAGAVAGGAWVARARDRAGALGDRARSRSPRTSSTPRPRRGPRADGSASTPRRVLESATRRRRRRRLRLVPDADLRARARGGPVRGADRALRVGRARCSRRASGWITEAIGYAGYFALTAAFALPAFAFLSRAARWIEPARPRDRR